MGNARFGRRGVLALFIVCATLSGCETTGDPRQGGLFGWSQKKADERRQELEDADTQARDRVSSEENSRQALLSKQTRLTAEQARLQGEVDRLLSENIELEGQLTQLLARKQLGDQEVARLSAVLEQNRQLRESIKVPLAHPAAPVDSRADQLNTQNQKLHREIVALLGRV